MIKITKYDPNKTYMFPSGHLATQASVEEEFPAIKLFQHIIETDPAEQTIFAVQNLAAVRGMMNIDPNLSDDDAIIEIEKLRNAPAPEPSVTAQERIAAALEYNNLLKMVE